MSDELRDKRRLDQALAEAGLAQSRARARDLITRGLVSVDGVIADKPSRMVGPAMILSVAGDASRWVSRGAEKLTAGLDRFGVDPAGTIALDIGASTGGFTEVLLARGASRVYAVDVGAGQLHPRLAADARVVGLEQTDARSLDAVIIPDVIDLVVTDVSFIALSKALPAALALARTDAWLIALVKPQFEVGPALVGKGGIVRDPMARQRALDAVVAWLDGPMGWQVAGSAQSPILGGDGNIEYLVAAVKRA